MTKTGGSVDIQFQCDKGDTFSGQSVYATGSTAELGSWNRANAVRLSSATYPSWRKVIPIEINQKVAWRYLKRLESDPDKTVVYEPDPDNTFSSSGPTTVFGSF